jgi:hypothetical protein
MRLPTAFQADIVQDRSALGPSIDALDFEAVERWQRRDRPANGRLEQRLNADAKPTHC